MKRLFLVFMMLLGVSVLNAQTFKFYYEDEEISDLVQIMVSEDDGGMRMDFFDIENISSSEVAFKVQIIKQKLAEGANVEMCFSGNCLTDTISGIQTLVAGDTMKHQFDLQYTFEDDMVSTVVVNLLDTNDETLQSFTVNYIAEAGLNTLAQTGERVALSLFAEPNPATTRTTVSYSVPAKYQTAQLVLRNSLGSVVRQSSVKTGISSKYTMNVSSLPNGVYFYSIVVGGKNLITKKLIVKH